jgi:hypothetical protein
MRDKRHVYDGTKNKRHNGTLDKMVEALDTIGEMTVREMARYLNVPKDNVSSLFGCLRRVTKERPVKRAYICGWTYDDEDCANPYPRPIYRLGSRPDVPKPPPAPRREKAQQSRDNRRARNRSTSVFNLAAGYKTSSLKHTHEG